MLLVLLRMHFFIADWITKFIFKQTMRTTILISFTVVFFASCLSTARLSDFSQSASAIDFDKLSREYTVTKTGLYTSETSNDYFFEKATSVGATGLTDAIREALTSHHYSIVKFSPQDQCVIGQRGMMANEWNSITAVYYRTQPNKVQVYLKTKITQDFTGGWRENRAMKIGKTLELSLSN